MSARDAVYAAPNGIAINPLPAQSPKLLDRLRHVLRAKHYSYRTEQAYVAWVRRFILFHGKRAGATGFASVFDPRGLRLKIEFRFPVPDGECKLVVRSMR